MITKEKLLAQAEAAISNYPTLAQFYQAKDPRLLGQLNAQAAMLSLFSEQLDVQAMEPFTKARDVTVLADAAVKGILPFGTPKTVSVSIQNVQAASFDVLTGRKLLDQRGREYTVSVGATIPANGTATVEAVQEVEVETLHTVAVNEAFYSIQIAKPENGYISRVRVIDAALNEYTYKAGFLNVAVGDKVFNLETDENQELFIKFGAASIAGVQPAVNDVFTIKTYVTEGAFDVDAGTKFVFDTSISPNEIGAVLLLDSVLVAGAAPMDIATMREIASYPSIYDESSVFLGNFDFLIRKRLSPIDFLSVWNEFKEEGVRGVNTDNINTIFVAAKKSTVAQPTLESEIKTIIKTADDSYKVSFVAIVEEEINITVNAQISPVYDSVAVEQKISELILGKYGKTSPFAKRGESKIKYREVYDLITDNVQALQGDQAGDLQVSIVYTGNDDNEPKHAKAYSWATTEVTVQFPNHGFLQNDVLGISNATDIELNGNVQVLSATQNSFVFDIGITGSSTGTLSVRQKQKPEKWRYVSPASISINIE